MSKMSNNQRIESLILWIKGNIKKPSGECRMFINPIYRKEVMQTPKEVFKNHTHSPVERKDDDL